MSVSETRDALFEIAGMPEMKSPQFAAAVNAYTDALWNAALWEAARQDATVTCFCGRVWHILPNGPDDGHGQFTCPSGADATVVVNARKLRLAEWHYTPLEGYGGVRTWQIGGWLREFRREWNLYSHARLNAADLPGRSCPVGQDVDVEVTFHGGDQYGTGAFIKIRWRQ